MFIIFILYFYSHFIQNPHHFKEYVYVFQVIVTYFVSEIIDIYYLWMVYSYIVSLARSEIYQINNQTIYNEGNEIVVEGIEISNI